MKRCPNCKSDNVEWIDNNYPEMDYWECQKCGCQW